MKPMEPMKPMAPMRPMTGEAEWWPGDLGKPASSGSQSGMRYAYFPETRRLAVEKDGTVTIYDSGDHRITGVSQDSDGDGTPAFSSESGTVRVGDLHKLG